MSRGQRRRNILNFPKMKVRGRRNKARLSARLHHKMTVRVQLVPGGTSERIDFAVDPKGNHIIEIEQVFDGYGRRVA